MAAKIHGAAHASKPTVTSRCASTASERAAWPLPRRVGARGSGMNSVLMAGAAARSSVAIAIVALLWLAVLWALR